MKKFNFNLSSVLKVRKQLETVAQREVFLAQEHLDKVKQVLKVLQDETENLEKELASKQRTGLSIHDYKDYLYYIQSLKKRLQQQQDVVFKSQNILKGKRNDVTKAMQKKKIIENIKDKQYDVWKEQFQKMEAKLTDELATIRYIRSKERL